MLRRIIIQWRDVKVDFVSDTRRDKEKLQVDRVGEMETNVSRGKQ